MLTYDMSDNGRPLYLQLYENVKSDIDAGRLLPDEKLPSKRTFAKNLGISTITVEKAYDQLMAEGYIYSRPKSGYYVSRLMLPVRKSSLLDNRSYRINVPVQTQVDFDFSSNRTLVDDFPFSVWAKVMRETISLREKELLEVPPGGGVRELREAICSHLASFRGMTVNPDQIIVGAGTEYLYGLLIQLLGNDKIYCLENPGYPKIDQIYRSHEVEVAYAGLDDQGIRIDAIRDCNAQIAHISPTHHFPTGITMPISRRYELLSWAGEDKDRYIIEDDYDSEFRLKGRPLPPLFGIDEQEKVIYINTFSKSLTSTIRISYMVLPGHLADRFYKTLSFYSCTVSTFEQYTLSSFIRQGYFEKHINRMRLQFGRRRKKIIAIIRAKFTAEQCRILENDSGLHFLLEFTTDLSDQYVKKRLFEQRIRIKAITDFDMNRHQKDRHQFLLNYSGMDEGELEEALEILKYILFGGKDEDH